jgi:hypothetical protein
MSNAADAATGQSIKRGDEIVALVIDRRTGGYPDAATHAAMHGIKPTNIFETLSLPVHGTYDEFGLIQPHAGQVGAAQVLDLTGQPDWKAFHAMAFGVDGGILVGGDKERAPRVLGLAIYRKATWEVLKGLSREGDRQKDIDTVLSLMDQVRTVRAGGDVDGAFRNANLLLLAQSVFMHADGRREHLPRLARSLGHREGGDLIGSDAVERLTRDGGPLGYDLMGRKADERVPELLGAIWDLQAAEDGLYLLGKPYVPSHLVGGHENGGQVFELGMSMLEEAGKAILVRHEDWPEGEGIARLDEMLGRLEEIRASLLDGLVQIRGRDFGP